MYIYFIESFLHGSVVNFVSGISQMTCITRMAAGHDGMRDSSDFSISVNGIRTYEKLVTFLMYHTVGWSSPNTFFMNFQSQFRTDFI